MTAGRVRLVALIFSGIAVVWLIASSGSSDTHVTLVVITLHLLALTLAGLMSASRLQRGALSLVAGLVTAGAGAGIAPAWLSKDGVSVTAIAGLVALVAGVSLIVLAVRDLATRRGRTIRIISSAGLVVVALLAVYSLAIAVAATNVPPTAITVTPADHGLAFESVSLSTADDIELAAWFVPSRNRAAVVLLHGSGSTRSSVVSHATVLAEHGYGVLLIDTRGHGASGGRAMDFGWYGDPDITAAVDFLLARPEVEPDRIAVMGMSMGGEQAIGAAAADSRIAAVVAEGATGRTAADKAWITGVYGWRGWVQRGIDTLTFGVADLLTEASPPLRLRDAVAAMAPRPLLLITAGEVPDETHAALFMIGGRPDGVVLWDVAGASHIGGLATDPTGWETRVIDFLDDALAP